MKIIITLLLILFFTSVCLASNIIENIGIFEYPPFVMKNQNEYMGFTIDILNLWAESTNRTTNYIFKDYYSLEKDFADNKIDIISNFIFRQENEYFSERLFELEEINCFPVVVFKYPNEYISISQLPFSSVIGVPYGFDYNLLFEKFNYKEFISFYDLTDSLINKEVDAIIIPYIFYEYITNEGYSVIKGSGFFDNYEYGILFNDIKTREDFTTFIDNNTDQYNEYLMKWFGDIYFPQSIKNKELKSIIVFIISILIILLFFILLVRYISKRDVKRLETQLKENTNFNIKAANLLNFVLSKNETEKSFFNKMLDYFIEFNNEIDKCSISIYKGDKVKFIAHKGYSDILYNQEINKDEFIIPETQTEIKNLANKNLENNFEWSKKLYKNGFIEIKNSLITPYKFNEEIIGNLTLDKFDEKPFSHKTKENALFLANLSSIYLRLKDQSEKLEKYNNEIRNTLLKAIELNSNFTQNHSLNVSILSKKIGEILNVGSDNIYKLELASVLHDIGKIGISENIINKRGKLTPEEYEEIKQHVIKGINILSESDFFKQIIQIVATHHERWDGKGYPYHLDGEKIPVLGRILCIADSIEAMSNDRPYRKGMPKEEILDELVNQSGKQFDPDIIKTVIENFDEILNSID